jgi:hypothetical protein
VSFVVKQTLAMFWLACALVFANAGFVGTTVPNGCGF